MATRAQVLATLRDNPRVAARIRRAIADADLDRQTVRSLPDLHAEAAAAFAAGDRALHDALIDVAWILRRADLR